MRTLMFTRAFELSTRHSALARGGNMSFAL